MRDRAEWRTLALISACYGLWFVLIFLPLGLPVWMRALLAIPLITLHSSLQHECMHAHPFRRQKLNDALMGLPIGILIPYSRFKATHLKHHLNENIADPYDDPESWYLDKPVWRRKSGLMKRLFLTNNTLVGRMLLGPAIGYSGFLRSEADRAGNGEARILTDWMTHITAVVLLLVVMHGYAQVPVIAYLVACYAGMGLLMVRTFLEHQAHERTGSRSVIIEDRGILALLFLNNNLHSVHHAYPALAWYRLPAFFRENRERFLKMNGGYRYDSYAAIFRRFALARKEPVEYPLERRRG